jgi:hypothetical protein
MRALFFGALLALSTAGQAFDPGVVPVTTDAGLKTHEVVLQPFEPLSFGYTKDSDDVPYIDVTLSLKILLLSHEWESPWVPRPYLGFTSRFGFYLDTRQNSPVVQKSYEPLLLLRWWGKTVTNYTEPTASGNEELTDIDRDYLDLAYVHQSNGQPVHTLADYENYYAALKADNQGQFVNDDIHRGWDFVELTKKSSPSGVPGLSTYADVKVFLPHGLLQKVQDEWHPDWETNPQGKRRKAVDGLAGAIQYQFPAAPDESASWLRRYLADKQVSIEYVTGYDTPFKYSTVIANIDVLQVSTLPVSLWLRDGYLSNLSMYYERVASVGIGVRMPATFW